MTAPERVREELEGEHCPLPTCPLAHRLCPLHTCPTASAGGDFVTVTRDVEAGIDLQHDVEDTIAELVGDVPADTEDNDRAVEAAAMKERG